MQTIFHVDRHGSLQANQTSGRNGTPYTFTHAGRTVLERHFPAELSPFGQRHVTNPPVDADQHGRPHPRWMERFGGRQALEYIWEHQRREAAPQVLSRLSAAFGCEDLEGARRFCRDRYLRDGANLSSWPTPHVRIWRLRAEVGHRGDMNWLPWGGALSDTWTAFTLADLVFCARRYWQGAPNGPGPFWELLLDNFWVEGLAETYDASEGGTIQPKPFQP